MYLSVAALLTMVMALQTPVQPRATKGPVFEVLIETSIKGEVERVGHWLSEDEVEALVMSGLENAGIRQNLVFVSRNRTGDRGDTTDRDKSGYYEGAGERGRYARPSHRLHLVIVLERTVQEESRGEVIQNLLDRVLGGDGRGAAKNAREIKEHVFLAVRANVFDAVTNASAGAVPRIEAKANSVLLRNDDFEIYHKETLRLLIFELKVKEIDVKIEKNRQSSSKGLELTTVTIDKACEQVAERLNKLASNLKRTQATRELTDIFADSISLSRQSISLSGSISRLKEGDILLVPVVPVDREPTVGEERHVYIKIKRVGADVATGVVIDVETGRAMEIESGFAIDRRRPIRRA